jgi:hypothetical protein
MGALESDAPNKTRHNLLPPFLFTSCTACHVRLGPALIEVTNWSYRCVLLLLLLLPRCALQATCDMVAGGCGRAFSTGRDTCACMSAGGQSVCGVLQGSSVR